MDWKLPALRFKHLIQVRDKTCLDLANLEHCAELDNIRQLGMVIDVLSPESLEEDFVGDNIKDAYDQLVERLGDFFPPAQRGLLREVVKAQREIYEASGSHAGEQQAG